MYNKNTIYSGFYKAYQSAFLLLYFEVMASRKRVKPLTEVEKEYFKRVGQRLKYYRLLRGYTNYETFANKFDIPRSTYGKYERGTNITLLTLYRILEALEVDHRDFHAGLKV